MVSHLMKFVENCKSCCQVKSVYNLGSWRGDGAMTEIKGDVSSIVLSRLLPWDRGLPHNYSVSTRGLLQVTRNSESRGNQIRDTFLTERTTYSLHPCAWFLLAEPGDILDLGILETVNVQSLNFILDLLLSLCSKIYY